MDVIEDYGYAIALVFINPLQSARWFFLALDGKESSPEYIAFEGKANFVYSEIRRLMQKEHGKPSPISVLDRSFIKTDFETLRKYEK